MSKFCKSIWTLPSRLSLLLVLAICACSAPEQKVEMRPLPPDTPFYRADSVTIYTMKGLKEVSKLTADRVDTFKRPEASQTDSTRAWNLFMQGADEQGNINTLVADSAVSVQNNNLLTARGHVKLNSDKGNLTSQYLRWRRDSDNEKMQAKGDVVLKSDRGNLYTQVLNWNRTNDAITTPGPVEIHRQGNISKGTRLQTDSNFNRIVMDSLSAKGKLNEKHPNF